MIHERNYALTYDKLVVVREFLRTSKHACLYIRNEHPCGFNVLNHAWGNHFCKTAKKTHVALSSIPPSIVTLAEYGCSLFCRHNLFCNGKYLDTWNKCTIGSCGSALRASCGFSCCFMTRFTFSLTESKTGWDPCLFQLT